jgi:hypothetical protein
MDLSVEQIIALAPDASAAAAGRKTADAKNWKSAGRKDVALWGECQGSVLYQVRIDLAQFAYGCTCPSRKLPCKHVLGLLLLAADASDNLRSTTAPEWLTAWLSKREARTKQRQEKAEQGIRAPDAGAQARRAGKRQERIIDGLDRLELWLTDVIRGGLAGVERQPAAFWNDQASRLVDAQAPGLASRVRNLGEVAGSGPDWPGRMLNEMGRIALLIKAYRRLDQMPPPLQADLRQMIGWTLNHEEVAAQGETVFDRWQVLGQRIEDEERLRVQRNWLRGQSTRRLALVLQFSAARQPFEELIVPGTEFDADLIFWPSAFPQRARIAGRRSEQARIVAFTLPSDTIDAFLAIVAAALARQPWLESFPALLRQVVPVPHNDRPWHVRDNSGEWLPLVRPNHWRLLAISGGRPVDLMAEWDGTALTPVGVLAEGRYYLLEEQRSITLRALIVDVLTKTALLGTAKAPAEAAGKHPADAVVPADGPEHRLLLQAAVRSIYRNAGATAEKGNDLPPVAAVGTCHECSAGAADLLRRMASHSQAEALLAEALVRLNRAHLCMPAELLAEALSWKPALTLHLAPVLGERGRWLCQFKSEWRKRFAGAIVDQTQDVDSQAADMESTWNDGSPAERKAILCRLRCVHADRARQWLADSWKQEGADRRADFLESLGIGLGADDEPFLETALCDSSKKVRGIATDLLARLPGSAQCRRLRELAAPMLTYTPPKAPGKLKALVQRIVASSDCGRLTVNPPQSFESSWKQAGLEEKPPSGTGQREFWLMQVMERIAPTYWSEHFQAAPPALLAALAEDDFALPLVRAWSATVLVFPSTDWLRALWNYWYQMRPSSDKAATAEMRRHWLTELQKAAKPIAHEPWLALLLESDPDIFCQALFDLPRPWSRELAQSVIKAMKDCAAKSKGTEPGAWNPAVLRSAAVAIPETCFDRALESWSLPEDVDYHVRIWLQELAAFQETVGFRRQFAAQVPLSEQLES